MKVELYDGSLPSVIECKDKHELLNTPLTTALHACHFRAPLTGDFESLALKVMKQDARLDMPYLLTAQEVIKFFSRYPLTKTEELAVNTIATDMEWAESLIKSGKAESLQLRVLNLADYERIGSIFHHDGVGQRILRSYNNPTTQFWEHTPPANIFDAEEYAKAEASRLAAMFTYDSYRGNYEYWEAKVMSMGRRLDSYIRLEAEEPIHFMPSGTFIRFNQRFVHRTPPQRMVDFKCRFLFVINF